MATIAELQAQAAELAARTEQNSITPQDVFGLQSSILGVIADMQGKIGTPDIATKDKAGIVKVGDGLSVTTEGTLSNDASIDTSEKILKYKKGDKYYIANVTELASPAKPTMTAAGTFDLESGGTKTVRITNNAGGTCYYTDDGSTPTDKSSSFTGSSKDLTFTVDTSVNSTSHMVKAFVKKYGLESSTESKTYVLRRKVTTPSISSSATDKYALSSTIAITSTPGATIYYTDDGTDPSSSETRKTYSSSFSLSSTKKIKAYAEKEGWQNSNASEATVTLGALMMHWGVVATVPTTDAGVRALGNYLKQDALPASGTLPASGVQGKKLVFAVKKDLSVSTIMIGSFEGVKVESTTTSYKVYSVDLAASAAGLKFSVN